MAKLGWTSKSEVDKQAEIRELKNYLSETDFYYLRQMETGTPVKPEIVTERIKARNRLKELGL